MKEITPLRKKNEKTYESINFNSSYSSSLINQSYSTAQVCLNKIQELRQIFYQAIDERKQLAYKNQQITEQISKAKNTIDTLLRSRSTVASPRPGSIVRLTPRNQNQSDVSFRSKLNTRDCLLNKDINDNLNDSLQSILKSDIGQNNVRKRGIKHFGGQKQIQLHRKNNSKIQLTRLLSPRVSKEVSQKIQQRSSLDCVIERTDSKIKMISQDQLLNYKSTVMNSPRRSYLRK